jgi:hypothetical protein
MSIFLMVLGAIIFGVVFVVGCRTVYEVAIKKIEASK